MIGRVLNLFGFLSHRGELSFPKASCIHHYSGYMDVTGNFIVEPT
jgi:hypothetical protein